MKTILIIASLLLAFATAGCDQKSDADKMNESWARRWTELDAENAQKKARWQAEATQSAIEQNTQALQELNSKLR